MYTSLVLWFLPTCVATLTIILISVRGIWLKRKLIAEIALALIIVGFPFVLVAQLSIVSTIILLFLQAVLGVLAARLLFGRMPKNFLRASTRLNAILGLILLAVAALLVTGFETYGTTLLYAFLLYLSLFVSLLIALAFILQTFWTIRHFKLRIRVPDDLPLEQLPTVTLAIPARNEGPVLTNCLSAALASDYPKLETIVLDDCSQDNTSEFIRVFAHDGVRFIQGDQPAEGWLGKNQAQQALASAASGDYIMFCGVDTHLSPRSISRLVSYMIASNKSMISVLPQCRDGLNSATLIWQLRYYWQIVLPITRHRVPVASQCWIIKADILKKLGSFEAAKNKIVAEGYFARHLFDKDDYRFIISDKELGITTAKRWSSQNETALRFLYPTFKRQPLFAVLAILCLVCIICLPIGLSICLSIIGQFTMLWVLSAGISLLFFGSYFLVVVRAVPLAWPLTLICFPLALTQEVILLFASLIAYEFGEVNWKGRNICYPVISTRAPESSNVTRAR